MWSKSSTHSAVVGDTDNGTAFFAGDLAKQAHHAFAALGIERGGGLISEDDLRRVRQGAGNGDALLFAPGEFLGQVVLTFADAEEIEQFLRDPHGFRAGHSVDFQRDKNVLTRRQEWYQVVRLEDEA
jgi:hypothetical protein